VILSVLKRKDLPKENLPTGIIFKCIKKRMDDR
jgi:hypothetical protein